MIEMDFLTYRSAELPWYQWEVPGVTLQSICIASVTTLLSIQATALIFDLLLGAKKRRTTTIRSTGILILTWKSSPIAILNALFRRDFLTRQFYGPDIPRDVGIARKTESVKVSTFVALVVLVLAAPVMDIIFIALSQKRSKPMTFAEAGFGGVAFGINEENPLQTTVYAGKSRQMVVKGRPQDETVVKFFVSNGFIKRRQTGDDAVAMVVIYEVLDQFFCVAAVGGLLESRSSTMLLSTGDQVIEIAFRSSPEKALKLVQSGMERLTRYCSNQGDLPEPTMGGVPKAANYTLVAPCSFDAEEATAIQDIETALDYMAGAFTLVASNTTLGSPAVTDVTNISKSDIQDITFLIRRDRNLGFTVLIVAAGSVILVRLLGSLLLSNDVHLGIECVIKDRLGLSLEDSLLRSSEVFTYRNKSQEGKRAHYGLEREGLLKVDAFDGGILS